MKWVCQGLTKNLSNCARQDNREPALSLSKGRLSPREYPSKLRRCLNWSAAVFQA
jgi:hypothetical protein